MDLRRSLEVNFKLLKQQQKNIWSNIMAKEKTEMKCHSRMKQIANKLPAI